MTKSMQFIELTGKTLLQIASHDEISPGEPVRFVLELKDGVAGANGIVVGDKMKHRAIAQAPGPAQPVNE